MRSALFWDFAQSRMLIPYRRFGITILRCVKSQKTAVFICVAVEAWNHFWLFFVQSYFINHKIWVFFYFPFVIWRCLKVLWLSTVREMSKVFLHHRLRLPNPIYCRSATIFVVLCWRLIVQRVGFLGRHFSKYRYADHDRQGSVIRDTGGTSL